MDENRIKEVFSDEGFVKKLFSMETPEEARAALAEKGIEVSVEEVLQLRDVLTNAAEMAQGGGNLSLEKLDDAAGGSSQTLATYVLTQEEIMSQLHGHSLGPVAFNGRNW